MKTIKDDNVYKKERKDKENHSQVYIPRIFEILEPEVREREEAKLDKKAGKREFFLEPNIDLEDVDLNDPYTSPLDSASFLTGVLLDNFNRSIYTIFSALFDKLYLRKQTGEFIKEKEIIKTLESITIKNIVKLKNQEVFLESDFNLFDKYTETGFAKSFNITKMKIFHLVELPGFRLHKFFFKSYQESIGWYRLEFRNKLIENIYLAKDPNWVKPSYFPYPSQEQYDAKQREWEERKKKASVVEETEVKEENGEE